MISLYPETEKILEKIKELDIGLDEQTLRELEDILFRFYDQTYQKGMVDAYLAKNLI